MKPNFFRMHRGPESMHSREMKCCHFLQLCLKKCAKNCEVHENTHFLIFCLYYILQLGY